MGTSFSGRTLVYLDRGTRTKLTVGEQLGYGGVGDVCAVKGDPRRCVKIFRTDLADETMRRLVEVTARKCAILASRAERGEVDDEAAAWPIALVYEPCAPLDEPRKAIGYLMERIDGKSLVDLSGGDRLSLRDCARLAFGFSQRVAGLHGSGTDPADHQIVVGDVDLANAMYDFRTGSVRLVDADSFQIQEGHDIYPSCWLRGVSPETLAGRGVSAPLSSLHDNYLVAKGVFEMLMGLNPLSLGRGDDSEDTEELAVEHRGYPYLVNRGLYDYPAPEIIVGERLAELFRKSFCGDWEEIPSASEYRHALRELMDAEEGEVSRCPMCGKEWLSRPGTACPFCGEAMGVAAACSSAPLVSRAAPASVVVGTSAPSPVVAAGIPAGSGGGRRRNPLVTVGAALSVVAAIALTVLAVILWASGDPDVTWPLVAALPAVGVVQCALVFACLRRRAVS